MLQDHSSSHDPNVALHDPNVASHDPSFSHDHNELFTALLTTLIQLYSHTTRCNIGSIKHPLVLLLLHKNVTYLYKFLIQLVMSDVLTNQNILLREIFDFWVSIFTTK